MKQNSYNSHNGNGILVSDNDLLKFITESQKIYLPEDNLGRRKTLNRFVGSCVVIQVSEVKLSDKRFECSYLVGPLNWTDSRGYSITVKGEEKQLPYSGILNFFKPLLC